MPQTPPSDATPGPTPPGSTPASQIDAAIAQSQELRRRQDLAHNEYVPHGIRILAAWSWRLIVLAGLLYLLTRVMGALAEVIIPVVIALLLSAVLKPLVDYFHRHRMPRSMSVALALLIALAAITGLVLLVVWQVQTNFGNLSDGVTRGIDQIRVWLDSQFGISSNQLNTALDSLQKWVSGNTDKITQGAVDTATTVAHVVTGLLVVLFSTIFFLKDGRLIWLWVVRVFVPRDFEELADEAGVRAWATLGGYVRATIAVAALDAVFIGLGVYLLGVPLAIPIAVLVFLFSFVPLFGATFSGLIAVLIALVFNGPITAVLVLAVVLGVQQIEGHVLQPVLMSRAVKVHPLAVVIGITTGVTVAGIIGALIAVPVIAMANTVGTFLTHHDPVVEARADLAAEQARGKAQGEADHDTVDAEAMGTEASTAPDEPAQS